MHLRSILNQTEGRSNNSEVNEQLYIEAFIPIRLRFELIILKCIDENYHYQSERAFATTEAARIEKAASHMSHAEAPLLARKSMPKRATTKFGVLGGLKGRKKPLLLIASGNCIE